MSELGALTLLGSPSAVKIKVQATVVFSILHSFARRPNKDHRVIGTLLGEIDEKTNTIVITDCFALPCQEISESENEIVNFKFVVRKDYHKAMYANFRRNNKKEVVVGWYTNTTPNGEFIIDHTMLIQNFYSNECEERDPIQLVVDTNLKGDGMIIKGYTRRDLTIDGTTKLASAFDEVNVDIELTEAESSCLFHMINGQPESEKWARSDILSKIPTPVDNVEKSITELEKVLREVQQYVDNVVAGKVDKPNRELGIIMSDALDTIQSQTSTAYAQSKLQDMLMVSYLSSLTQTQTHIAEKLNEIL